MKAKLMAVLLIPLLASGCMIAGMAVMGGGGHMTGGGALHRGIADSARQPTVIKEVMSGSLRVTAEFPFFTSGDSLRYVATIQDRDGRARTENAIVFLEVSSAAANVVATPAPTHAGHPSTIVHAPSDVGERTRVTPVERAGGRYVFRPTIPTEGAYDLAVVVEQVGDSILDPPVVVDHTTAIARGRSHARWKSDVTPLVFLGAAFMAVMMVVAIR
ncbi:MAG TPA: hypothetical protein VGJ96_09040 [Gemmatimonadaceae bacterium]|jgi:hypothetical protein